jgi:hypothetical protein
MGKRLTDQEREWRSYSEKAFQSKVMKYAREHGWTVAHFHDSRKMVRVGPGIYKPVADGDAAGFPDLVAVRGPEILFWELKKELPLKPKPRPKQVEWLNTLTAGGFEARVVKPSDWDYVVQRLA